MGIYSQLNIAVKKFYIVISYDGLLKMEEKKSKLYTSYFFYKLLTEYLCSHSKMLQVSYIIFIKLSIFH